jgi:hypothetical protein
MQTATSVQPQYEVSDQDKARQKKIAAAWTAYHGELDPPLIPMPDEADDNVMSNRMQPIVDRGVDFLFGKPLGVTVEEGAPQEAQDFLEQSWGKNESRLPLLQKLAMSGAIAGQACMRVVPSKDEQTFRLIVIDPSTLFVRSDPQDCETVQLYCIEYSTTENVGGKLVQVYYHEEITRVDADAGTDTDGYADTNPSGYDQDDTWSIAHWTRISDRGPWSTVGQPIPWNYDFPPLFTCQNLPSPHEWLGMPDISNDLIGMNKSLNLVSSNINRIIKIYGGPVLFANGVGESEIDLKLGRIHGLPNPDSKISAVTISSDIANALSFAATLRSDVDEQSAVPAVATGRITDLPRGNISGVALELLFMPLLQKTEKKRCLYGKLIIDVSKALLILGNFSDDIDITLEWQQPIPHDDLASVQSALAKVQLGISKFTVIGEQGYDPQMEMDRSLAEQQQQQTQQVADYAHGIGLPPGTTGGTLPTGEPATPTQSMAAPMGARV